MLCYFEVNVIGKCLECCEVMGHFGGLEDRVSRVKDIQIRPERIVYNEVLLIDR